MVVLAYSAPLLGNESNVPTKRSAIALSTFLAECKAKGETAISGYRPVFAYAESIRLPTEFLQLAWFEFIRQFGKDGVNDNKRQKDWRRTFRNYVEHNYLRLWYLDDCGEYRLTQTGKQAKLANAHRLSS